MDTTLEWARVEDGRCRPEIVGFDLADLIEEVVAELEGPAMVRGVALDVALDASVRGTIDSDRRLVRLVLINLIEHAVAVTRDGRVDVRATADAHRTQISVRDGAPLMSEEARVETFDPLAQSHDLQRSVGAGSGLGVYAVCGIASAVGGEIRLDRDDLPGNKFVLEIPRLA